MDDSQTMSSRVLADCYDSITIMHVACMGLSQLQLGSGYVLLTSAVKTAARDIGLQNADKQ